MKRQKNFKVKVRLSKDSNTSEKEKYKKLSDVFDLVLAETTKIDKKKEIN